LDLTNNKIESIPDGFFSQLVSLKQLFLYCNKIFFKDQNGNVQENIFQGLTRLEHLNLSNNQISYLPQGLFQDLVNLKYLDLNNNKIESMPDRLFLPLVSLKMLGLGDNKITFKDKNGHIQEDIFQGLVRLETLNLQYNPIDYLPQRFFQYLVKLSEICLICDQIDNLSKFIPHNITIT
jgi:Leucine-rich repeat (LRR) protein